MSYRIKESKERFLREEREEFERKVGPLVAQAEQTLQQLQTEYQTAVRQFWSRPLKVLATARMDSSAKDGGLALADGDCSPADTRTAFIEFDNSYVQKTGYTLSDQGAERLMRYANIQRIAGKKIDRPEDWFVCLSRLIECDCFAQGELEYNAELKAIEPEKIDPPRDLLAELDAQATDTREGQRRARQLVNEHVYGVEARKIWQEWIVSVRNNFGHTLSEEEQKAAFDFFTRQNISYLDRRNYDRARRNLVSRYILPDTCLTQEELLAREVENRNTPFDYHSRRELADKLAKFGTKILN